MRGHIGYKIPRQPTPTIRLSFAAFDALTFEEAVAESRISFLSFDALTYAAATAEQYLAYLSFDAITYSPASEEVNIGYVAFDAITYTNTAPEAPTDLFGEPVPSGLKLTWRPATASGQAVTDHTVAYSTDGTNWTTVNTGSGDATYTVTGLVTNTLYTFKVAATNSIGTSPYSATVDAAPMAAVDAFTATTYYTEDWGWDQSTAVVQPNSGSFISYLSNVHYFSFWPPDYDSGETYFQFVTVINDSLGTNRKTTCASTTYLETGANEASCEYSYQYQRRAIGTNDWTANWNDVHTEPVTTNFGNTGTLSRPRYPYELAVTQGYTTALFYLAGVKYEHRCIVTRKSDGAKYVTRAHVVVTSSNINN